MATNILQDVLLREEPAELERLIALCCKGREDVKASVLAARKVPGKLSGVAAIAIRYACRGENNAKTTENIDAITDRFQKEGQPS